MRIIKLGLISFIFLFLLFTGISLFIPSHIRISRAIQVQSGHDSVMALLTDPVRWKQWLPGADSAGLFESGGKITGVKTSAATALVIKKITDSSVIAENTGAGSRQGENSWQLLSGGDPGTSNLQWYMDFHLRWYPWEKFSSLLFEQSYGAKMERGLSNLKKMAETPGTRP